MKEETALIFIGGAGINVAKSKYSASLLEKRPFWVIDSDRERIDAFPSDNSLYLGEVHSVQDAIDNIIRVENKLKEILSHFKQIKVIGGLGGLTATGAIVGLAKLAHSLDVSVTVMVFTPFLFEGKRCESITAQAINDLRQYVDKLVILKNKAKGSPNMKLSDFFGQQTQKLIGELFID